MRRQLSQVVRHGVARWWVRCGSLERGDVPGWVLVTMMTAGLVAGLWAVAGNTLNELFRNAVSGVSGP